MGEPVNAKRLPDGKLRVPVRVEGADGTIGDSVQDIGPDHPDYEAWDRWLRANEQEEDE